MRSLGCLGQCLVLDATSDFSEHLLLRVVKDYRCTRKRGGQQKPGVIWYPESVEERKHGGGKRLLLLLVSLRSTLQLSILPLPTQHSASRTQPPLRGVPAPLLVRRPVVQLMDADFLKPC